MLKRKISLYDDDDDDDLVETPPKKIETKNDGNENSKKTTDSSNNAVSSSNNDVNKQTKQFLSSTSVNHNKGYTTAAIAWRKGEREEMQDRHLVADRLLVDLCDDIKTSSLFALFDGHAGKLAAEFCEKNFATKFRQFCAKCLSANKDMSVMEKAMKKIFIDTYKSIDEDFLKEARSRKPTPLKDGTTATTLFLLNQVLYCANIGDSKAVVCRKKPDSETVSPIQITFDHSPLNFEERTRIQKAGGNV
uniref:PPM-type phosphatase domain-containing protein n=1 Tax=Acrobeloides nanus TaxID=290746 RepID=A0A914CKJ1_9BILA